MFCLKNYGLVPQEAMPGIMYGDSLPVHNELDAVAGAYVDAIAKGRLTKLTPVWKNGLSAITTLTSQMPMKTFTYKGKEYTPKTFGESLGINPDDYVSLTSYTHHPFYTQFCHRNSGQLAQRPFLEPAYRRADGCYGQCH